MKKFFGILVCGLVLVAGSSSFAADGVRTTLACQPVVSMPDSGIYLNISVGARALNEVATIQMESIAGMQRMGSFLVKSQAGHIDGKPVEIVVGNQFRLVMTEDNFVRGGYVSRLNAVTSKGQRIHANLICTHIMWAY